MIRTHSAPALAIALVYKLLVHAAGRLVEKMPHVPLRVRIVAGMIVFFGLQCVLVVAALKALNLSPSVVKQFPEVTDIAPWAWEFVLMAVGCCLGIWISPRADSLRPPILATNEGRTNP